MPDANPFTVKPDDPDAIYVSRVYRLREGLWQADVQIDNVWKRVRSENLDAGWVTDWGTRLSDKQIARIVERWNGMATHHRDQEYAQMLFREFPDA